MKNLILGMLLVSVLTGCSNLTTKITREVKDNVFYSSLHPKIKITIDKKYEYLGKNKKSSTASSFDSDSKTYLNEYIFVEKNYSSKVLSGIVIRINRINSGIWSEDIYMNYKNGIINDVVKYNDLKYKQFIFKGGVNSHLFYTDKGIYPPRGVLKRIISRNVDVSRNIQFQIVYYEGLNGLNIDAFNASLYSWEDIRFTEKKQLKSLREFIKRAESSINFQNFLDEDISILQDNMLLPKSNSEILVELKKLMDQGIITEQEFETKKKEILERF